MRCRTTGDGATRRTGSAIAMAVLAMLAPLLINGCRPAGPTTPKGAPAGGQPLRFWHTQTQENEQTLKAIVADYNRANPTQPPLEATYVGDYTQLYEKIRGLAAQQDKTVLPDLAVAYESMIADYMKADIVRPLDDLLTDPKVGLDEASRQDILPAYLDTNRFAQFDNQLLSFPFTKSNLMLYYNETMLKKVGCKPPETWDDFLAACRAVKDKLGIVPMICYPDASALDGLILSMGGGLIADDQSRTKFGEPATLEAYRLLNTLYKEGLASQVVDKNQQVNDFANEKCAIFWRTSAARPTVQKLVGSKFSWGMKGLPHQDGVEPVTVMFGANICLFRSTLEREKLAWGFIKYFTSAEVTARWATATGYLPVRQSAATAMKSFFDAAPQNRAAFDALPTARPEPNAAGWQKVRKCLENADTALASQVKSPEDAVKELAKGADDALKPAGK